MGWVGWGGMGREGGVLLGGLVEKKGRTKFFVDKCD